MLIHLPFRFHSSSYRSSFNFLFRGIVYQNKRIKHNRNIFYFHRSSLPSLPCLMHRWAVGIFQLHRRSHPSLRSSKRHLWIHSTSATTGQFRTSPSSRSSLSVPPTSKLLDTWSVTIYSRCCNQPTRSIVPRRRRQSKWCPTSTKQLTQALSRCSAFSISAPLSILSTTWSFWFDLTPRHLGARAQVDRVLPDRAFAVLSFQWRNFGHNDGHFRRPSGIDARPDPLYRILCRSHWHRGAARLQRACFCRWLTGLRARCAARSCSPSHADVHVHREYRGLDEFQPTSSQPFKDGADMVGLQPSSAPLQQYRNEGVGHQPSARWLCPRSVSPHRQWDDAGEARQPHFGCLLIPAPTTANHPSIPHLGRCSCSGTRTHTHAYRLLQRAPHFLSALSDW